jgi:MarR family transcriptional regulator, organic hydroperoxide resistance regulator
MAGEKPPPEFMSALGTEYFVLQSTASSTIGESGSRVSIYLSSLASGLVAIGFASSSPRGFASLAFTVLQAHAGCPQLVRRDRHDRPQPGSHLDAPDAAAPNAAAHAAAVLPLPENQPERKLLSPVSKLKASGGGSVSDLRRLFNDIIRFEIELWNAIDARLKSEFDLPLTHFEPMAVIDGLPGCRVYDIARELGITTGGTSKLVDRIEASGYCRRLPNPADRRSSLLELTPAGLRLLAEAGVAFDEELQSRLGAAVPERTLRQFGSTLTRLRAAGQRLAMEEIA